MLWQRSLVMQDQETGSLWSHILGEAMQGPLAGATLEAIPSSMTTWGAWKRTHPKTTVLNLSRTVQAYTKDFYQRPEAFLFGIVLDGQPRAYGLAVLQQHPVVQDEIADTPVLVWFDPASVSAQMYRRQLGDQVLTFRASGGRLEDEQTGSTWDGRTGRAIAGPAKGKRLEALPVIMSFRKAWKVFHPDSTDWRP